MRLGCQMDNSINFPVLHQLKESLKIADIHFHKLIVGFILNIFEVRQVAGIRQFVEIDDMIIRILVHEKAYHMTANKACTTSDDYIHIFMTFKMKRQICLFIALSDGVITSRSLKVLPSTVSRTRVRSLCHPCIPAAPGLIWSSRRVL